MSTDKKSTHIHFTTLIMILIMTFYGVVNLVYGNQTFSVNIPATMNEKLFQRKRFQNDFYKTSELLTYYEKGDSILELHNPSKKQITIKSPALFYDMGAIRKDIAIAESDLPVQRVKKIFDFVKNNRKHTIPLFENSELHNPPRFFSVYGSGFCDDAAINMAQLATYFGFEARTYWLEGHVVADIKYNGEWHIYDPDALGIIYYGKNVASIDQMVLLATNNQLEKYNEIYRTTENNQATSVYPLFKPDNPSMDFLPEERKKFYDTFFMLPTDGHYLNLKEINTKEKFSLHYETVIANFIREIPIGDQCVINGEVIIHDYFPFAGAFISIPGKELLIAPKDFPEIYTEFDIQVKGKDHKRYSIRLPDGKIPGGWLKPFVNRTDQLVNSYLNLTPGIKTVQNSPGTSIKLRKLNALMKVHKDIKLLTVHYYCSANARFEDENLNTLKTIGINTKKNVH